jgi:uncharacterized protein YyaL (SSP411 family)
MLYDNALLVGTISEAYQLTQLPHYAAAVRHTLAFVQRELTAPGGGFFSALDADSEGVEGKFYTWSKVEIDSILGSDSDLFCKVYDASERGNWEHTNILWMPRYTTPLSEEENATLARCRDKLFAVREKRIRPLLDDKILLGWNALMITACCKAYRALGEVPFLEMATAAIQFLEAKLQQGDGWLHSWKENKPAHAAFLDDYAYLVQAYIHLGEVTGNNQHLLKARKITAYVQQHFWDNESGFFFFTPDYQSDVVVRKKDVHDGAMPSGNSVMAGNLYYLAFVFDEHAWLAQSRSMVQSMASAITRHATSFGVWGAVIQNMVYGMNEIVVTGTHATQTLAEVLKHFIPNSIVQLASAPHEDAIFSLLQGKEVKAETAIYVCKNKSCLAPVSTVAEALKQVENW